MKEYVHQGKEKKYVTRLLCKNLEHKIIDSIGAENIIEQKKSHP